MTGPARGSPRQLVAALRGRYTIERPLGEGGMATVYLAQDVRHDRQVALKVLKPELAAIVGAERFLAEIRTTANLQHPHILPLFDSGEAEGFLFFVMPYVEGESLRARLDREGELPVDEAVGIATAVANALDYAHRHGVIHRDIKPANILLHDGEPLVADFGIALAVSAAGGGRLTETGLSLGTPYYMSPEQATAERDPDARSDVYALGCVLYEMLVGEPPYTGASAQAVLGKVLTTEPTRPTELRRAVPVHVEAALLKALEKRPADRFGTAGELGAALNDPQFGIGVRTSTERVEISQGASRFWMSSAVLALLVAAAVFFVHLTEDQSWQHQLRYTVPLPTEGDTEGLYFHYRISPDGRYLAVSGVIGPSAGIFVRETSSLEWRVLAGTSVSDFFWSPDSRALAFFADGRLMRVSVDGGPVEDLASAGSSSVYEGSGSWGTEGDIVYSVDRTGPLVRIPAQGGEPVPVTSADLGVGHRYPAFLPDGEHLLFTVRGGDVPGVYVVSLDDSASRRLLPDVSAAIFAPTPSAGDLGHVIFAREGRLMALPFDSDALEFTGDAFPLSPEAPWNDTGGIAVSASDNGILIFRGGRDRRTDSRLFWVDREGTKVDSLGPVGMESSITLSSSSRTAALVRQTPTERAGNVWLRDLDRRREDPITFDGKALTFTNAVVSPGGESVVYAWTDVENTELRITPVQAPDDAETVASTEGGSLNPTDWTQSGYLVYTQIAPETGADLWYVVVDNASGSFGEPVPFRADPFETSFGQVSPDGDWIAYLSDETGFMEVWVEPFPAGSGRWRVSETQLATGFTQQPRWSADGRELFYITGAAARTLWVAPFAPTTEGGSPVGQPRPLFDAAFNAYAPRLGTFFYDVAGDGERFLASLVGDAEDPVLNVLVNWQLSR